MEFSFFHFNVVQDFWIFLDLEAFYHIFTIYWSLWWFTMWFNLKTHYVLRRFVPHEFSLSSFSLKRCRAALVRVTTVIFSAAQSSNPHHTIITVWLAFQATCSLESYLLFYTYKKKIKGYTEKYCCVPLLFLYVHLKKSKHFSIMEPV